MIVTKRSGCINIQTLKNNSDCHDVTGQMRNTVFVKNGLMNTVKSVSNNIYPAVFDPSNAIQKLIVAKKQEQEKLPRAKEVMKSFQKYDQVKATKFDDVFGDFGRIEDDEEEIDSVEEKVLENETEVKNTQDFLDTIDTTEMKELTPQQKQLAILAKKTPENFCITKEELMHVMLTKRQVHELFQGVIGKPIGASDTGYLRKQIRAEANSCYSNYVRVLDEINHVIKEFPRKITNETK